MNIFLIPHFRTHIGEVEMTSHKGKLSYNFGFGLIFLLLLHPFTSLLYSLTPSYIFNTLFLSSDTFSCLILFLFWHFFSSHLHSFYFTSSMDLLLVFISSWPSFLNFWIFFYIHSLVSNNVASTKICIG